MCEVNVDEIKVGDLVETMYGQERWLCYVTRLDIESERYKGIWSDNFKEEWDHMDDLTGHWKVINFDELPDSPFTEEEKQMDELKVYTGKETIEALLEGKALQGGHRQYKLDGNVILYKDDSLEWTPSKLSLQIFLKNEFTEVATPQVGDWVRVTDKEISLTGQITKVDEYKMWAYWNGSSNDGYTKLSRDWEILSPEQVSEYKREQAFVKVGRKPNEFKHGDIVYIDALATVATVITKNNGMEEIKLHGINEAGKGYTARAHQLTPISFVEQQVDLS